MEKNREATLVKAKNLSKYFDYSRGKLHAVDHVNIDILRGKTLGVVGESGCGKTTLGRAILRLTEPTDGDIFFEGENISKFNKRQMNYLRRKIQIIFQDPYSSLDPRMTVSNLIAEYLVIQRIFSSRKQIYKRVAELMDMVGIAKRLSNAYPHELDGGRRQRVGIARAISLNPKFIVCDEPVSALDVSIQAQILNLLMDFQDELNLTYMFISHDISVVKHISDEIMVMYLGQCVEKAYVDELFKNPQHPYTKALFQAVLEPDLSVRKKKLKVIKGEVTSPINPKPGCRFAARCPLVCDKCKEKDPELIDIGNSHLVACTLVKPKIE